jgi:hypothetical protein
MHRSKVLEKKIKLVGPRAADAEIWAGVTRSAHSGICASRRSARRAYARTGRSWPEGPDMGQLQQDARVFATRRNLSFEKILRPIHSPQRHMRACGSARKKNCKSNFLFTKFRSARRAYARMGRSLREACCRMAGSIGLKLMNESKGP